MTTYQIKVCPITLLYRTLLLFIKNSRLILTKTQLLEKLWDVDGNFVDEHTLTTIISRIRKVYKQLMPDAGWQEFLQTSGSQLDKLDFLIQAMVKTSRLETGFIYRYIQWLLTVFLYQWKKAD